MTDAVALNVSDPVTECEASIRALEEASTEQEACSALKKLNDVLEVDAVIVSDGILQQASVIRAARLAKENMEDPASWPEDAYRQVLYKFADSADVAAVDEEAGGDVSLPKIPGQDEVVIKTYGLKEMCAQAAKSFTDPLFLLLLVFVGFVGVVWIPRAITSKDKLNGFRQIGDLLHFVAFFVLMLRLYRNRSAAGISHKSQELMLVVFLSRYSDLFTTWISEYNTVMKVLYIILTATIIICVKYVEPFSSSHARTKDDDRFPHLWALVACLVIAMAIEAKTSSALLKFWWNEKKYVLAVQEVLWMFSLYVEAIAIIPQLIVIRLKGEIEKFMLTYLFLLGSYRAFYIANWVYRDQASTPFTIKDNLFMILAGCLQELPYLYFLSRIPKWRKWY